MEREIKGLIPKMTKIICLDEPGQGNACHEYIVTNEDKTKKFVDVHFQNGPIKEFGVNGCQNEDLISIVIDRLECFQSGKFPCKENGLALDKLYEALHWLNHRTLDRINRNVEGLNKL